jgi:hypothetical protein
VKLRKRAATVPFFTPIIALILCIILSIVGIFYGLWTEDENKTDDEHMEQIEQHQVNE